MNKDFRADRLISLANGARIPFADAADRLAVVNSYLEDPDQEWELVYLLRRACLDQPLDHEHRQALIRAHLLLPDGTVESSLKEVVLSAVRGQGRVLRVESPFTDPLDRAMAEYLNAREYVRSALPPADAAAFLNADPVQESVDRVLKATAPPQKWADRHEPRGNRTDDPPPLP